ncbi:MAG: hypothetical protein H6709_11415 [Kofleriaceae bacterium]|nr:hypothetical protein [Kofleriaceae bacterium]MCB9572683.1 hypothetical protein [Kofleriaceae bacterium]
MWKIAAITLISLGALGATAAAHPPPPPPERDVPHRPAVEWSTWVRVGYGVAHDGAATEPAQPRVVTPPVDDDHGAWDAAVGADLTLPLGTGGDVRLGPWVEASTQHGPVAGAELLVGAVPGKLDLFWYRGEGVVIVRAGASREIATVAVSYGYRAPWSLWGPWRGPSRYMIGARLVASATRALDDPADWSVNVGVEVEPVGALRYLLGIRSWY